MKIFINNHPYELPEGATVTDAVAAIEGPAALRCRCQHQLCAQHALRSTRFAAGRPRRSHLPL